MSASAFSTTLMVAADACRLLQGETEIGGIHGDQGHHHHCNWCKSWVYTEAVGQSEWIYVRATLLDDPYWIAPWLETQTAEKPNWAVTGAQRSFAHLPDDFQKLLADYREPRSGWILQALTEGAEPRPAKPTPVARRRTRPALVPAQHMLRPLKTCTCAARACRGSSRST